MRTNEQLIEEGDDEPEMEFSTSWLPVERAMQSRRQSVGDGCDYGEWAKLYAQ
jgi:hypothetical protein